MDVILVCHTEPGSARGKEVLYTKQPEGAGEGAARLLDLVKPFGARVTFAVAPEIAHILPDCSGHEIGLHVHPGWWQDSRKKYKDCVAGDAYLRERCGLVKTSTVLRDYTLEEQKMLIRAGKKRIQESLGATPTTFVAGRWSINPDTITALISEGFTRDCSAIAHAKTFHYDWSGLPRVCMPYHPAKGDYQAQGDLPFTILPISQYFPRGNLNPEAAPLVGVLWLKACITEYCERAVPFLHMCVHSPSMMSAYYRNVLQEMLGHLCLQRNDIRFRLAAEIRPYGMLSFRTDLMAYLPAINPRMIFYGLSKVYDIIRYNQPREV